MVWKLIRQETAEKLFLCGDDKVACFYVKKRQAARLTTIMAYQRQERQQMKRHQGEEIGLLKQVIKIP